MLNKARICLAILAGLVLGCQSQPLQAESMESQRMFVHQERAECVGEMVKMCLRTSEKANGPWELFYDEISGFEHEPGYRYELLVQRIRKADVPQDVSMYEWKLLKIIEKVKVP